MIGYDWMVWMHLYAVYVCMYVCIGWPLAEIEFVTAYTFE